MDWYHMLNWLVQAVATLLTMQATTLNMLSDLQGYTGDLSAWSLIDFLFTETAPKAVHAALAAANDTIFGLLE